MRGIILIFLCLILNNERLVGQENKNLVRQKWVKIKDQKTHLEISFPQAPLDLIYYLPFDYPLGKAQLQFYSAPVSQGVLIASFLTSDVVNSQLIEEEEFKKLFQSILIPRLLYSPHVFQNNQNFQVKKKDEVLNFQVTYLDHETSKKIKGVAMIRDQKIKDQILKSETLFLAFYLASEKDFHPSLFEQFIHSIH